MEDKNGSNKEHEAAQNLFPLIPDVVKENPQLALFICLAALRSKDYDLVTAGEFVVSYFQWRIKVFGHLGEASLENNKEHMESCFLTVLPEFTDQGQAIIYYRPRLHLAVRFSALSALQVFHYLVLSYYRTHPSTQKAGFIMFVNLEGFGLLNVDLKLPALFSKFVMNIFPMKLSAVYLIRPPVLFRLFFPLRSLLISSSLENVLVLVEKDEQLQKNNKLSDKILPFEIGGSRVYDYDQATRLLLEGNIKI